MRPEGHEWTQCKLTLVDDTSIGLPASNYINISKLQSNVQSINSPCLPLRGLPTPEPSTAYRIVPTPAPFQPFIRPQYALSSSLEDQEPAPSPRQVATGEQDKGMCFETGSLDGAIPFLQDASNDSVHAGCHTQGLLAVRIARRVVARNIKTPSAQLPLSVATNLYDLSSGI